ncbi:helix-turn-helix domain-containing protein [Paenibacillus dokdonensis]|uniref:helix-turn-helix domain-containing protein n=1 Tax=Paenibacillus dokdonensis TaxID=2567944 RepID=UPI0010A900BD|nr:helix-turn-helix transcriptional regulator [Paenibacillus dokdonensis]
MSERMEWKIKRIQRNIKQIDVAAYLKCSSTLISLYENNKGEMSPERINRYKQFIEGNN